MPAGEASFGGRRRPPALASALAAVVALSLAASLARAAGDDPPTLTGVRVGGDFGHARVVVEFDRPLFIAPELMANSGGDVALAFLSGVGDLPREGQGFGPIRHWGLATADGVQAELFLRLGADARIIRRFGLEPARVGGPWRYVIDVVDEPVAPIRVEPVAEEPLVAANGTVPAVAAPLREPASAPPPRRRRHPPPAAAPERAKVVVIDPGHGGFDPGARGVGVAEKNVNLAEALTLRDRLRRSGLYQVVLTREADIFVPLDERVRIARRAGADLFISLHADSAGADPNPRGASVYTLSDHGLARVDEVIGPGEWMARRDDPGVGRILLDLTQRSTLNRSAVFAGLLIDRIGRDIDLLPRTHRDAGYFVLLAPDVPAVLLEMGFITSPIDQARLTDPGSRDKLADAIAAAIDTYFAGSTAAPADATVRGADPLVRASGS